MYLLIFTVDELSLMGGGANRHRDQVRTQQFSSLEAVNLFIDTGWPNPYCAIGAEPIVAKITPCELYEISKEYVVHRSVEETPRTVIDTREVFSFMENF